MYIYIIAGLYLLYIDYTFIKDWGQMENNMKIIAALAGAVFAVFSIGIIIYSLKTLKEIQKNNEELIKQIEEEKEEDHK